ncbi:MAG TPA: SRPBCC domain-containing protein [Nitrosopumilaceae archaeon]|nr:SRPBCC domain-containing protein [Nitrosopumilaceae archaeon]
MTGNEIRKIIEIDASPEVVFKALTNIDELTQWFPDQGTFEARVGGKIHFTMLAKSHKQIDRDHFLEGEVLEIVPNKKLVYTFIPDDKYRPDSIRVPTTTVTWNLEEIGKNKTRVTLIHSGFTKEMSKQFKETIEGWNYFTARLVQYCKSKNNTTREN